MLKQAFEQALDESKRIQCSTYYLTLWRRETFYGGPEEGGWYGSDHIPVEYAIFNTEAEAEEANLKVQQLAVSLSAQARVAHSSYCLSQLEFLEARGLDADFLPDPDGPDEYYVDVSSEPPRAHYGSRHYE